MGCTRKEAAEHAEWAAEHAEWAAKEAAKEAEKSADFANKVVEGAAADERAAVDKAVKYAADERAAAEQARAAAEQARAAAEQAPDECVRSNRLLNEAKLATDKVDDMQRVGPTGTWKGRFNKYNPCSAKAWRDRAEDCKQAAEAWARAAAS